MSAAIGRLIRRMAEELSSNWKKLQAKIKAESSSSSSSSSHSCPARTPKAGLGKRKAADGITAEATKASQARNTKKKTKLADDKTPISSASKIPPSPSPSATTGSSSRPAPMGVTQSSAVTKGTRATITPSLALWASDHDISPEDLAEAYGLGLSKPATATPASSIAQPAERENEGAAPGLSAESVGKYVALDCEMVGLEPDGRADALARVSLVDYHGRQVYDSYVRPREEAGERVRDYRTAITGITAARLARSGRAFDAVQAEVAALLRGRVLVGHDLRHDLAALRLRHPPDMTRDTVRHPAFRRYAAPHGRSPALRVLARELLGLDIHAAAHSSVEDARVAMLLFRHRKSDFDVAHAARYAPARPGPGSTRQTGQQQQQKKKNNKNNKTKKKK
ncbi:ribonuclease H-like domain-containing protein [Biscogniauxia sp. FL1348]|nr:ribonuclease H-like domain-containing protein [Biscogniauxia sp. FL1348]